MHSRSERVGIGLEKTSVVAERQRDHQGGEKVERILSFQCLITTCKKGTPTLANGRPFLVVFMRED